VDVTEQGQIYGIFVTEQAMFWRYFVTEQGQFIGHVSLRPGR
jgi:hypothetical protein